MKHFNDPKKGSNLGLLTVTSILLSTVFISFAIAHSSRPVEHIMEFGRQDFSGATAPYGEANVNGRVCIKLQLVPPSAIGRAAPFSALLYAPNHIGKSEFNVAVGASAVGMFTSALGAAELCVRNEAPFRNVTDGDIYQHFYISADWLHMYPPVFESTLYQKGFIEAKCESLSFSNPIDPKVTAVLLSANYPSSLLGDSVLLNANYEMWLADVTVDGATVCWYGDAPEGSFGPDNLVEVSLLLLPLDLVDSYLVGDTIIGPLDEKDYDVGKVTVAWPADASTLGLCVDIINVAAFSITPFVFTTLEYNNTSPVASKVLYSWIETGNNFGFQVCVAQLDASQSLTADDLEVTIHYLAVQNVQSPRESQWFQLTEGFIVFDQLNKTAVSGSAEGSQMFIEKFTNFIAEVAGIAAENVTTSADFEKDHYYFQLHGLKDGEEHAKKVETYMSSLPTPFVIPDASEQPNAAAFFASYATVELTSSETMTSGFCLLSPYSSSSCSESGYGDGGVQNVSRTLVTAGFGAGSQSCYNEIETLRCHNGDRLFVQRKHTLESNLDATTYAVNPPPLPVGDILGIVVSALTAGAVVIGTLIYCFRPWKSSIEKSIV